MTEEPLPRGRAQEREFPDGTRGYVLHVNRGPLPEDPAERAIEIAKRKAVDDEIEANMERMDHEAEEFDEYLYSLDGRWRWFYDILDRIGGLDQRWRRKDRLLRKHEALSQQAQG